MVSPEASEVFDPESMLPQNNPHPVAKRGKFGVSSILEPSKVATREKLAVATAAAQQTTPLYHEIVDRLEEVSSPEDLSRFSAYPIVDVRLMLSIKEEVAFVGCLKNLSVLNMGEFLHIDLELSSKFILGILPSLSGDNVWLSSVTSYIGGKPTKHTYSSKVKLRSVVCKDFQGTITQCKLVFIRR